jgi:hypothetical protein
MTRPFNPRSPYPEFFRTPEGRAVSIRKMAIALKAIRGNPDVDYPGWNWFPTPGHHIVRNFRDGLNDRINKRGELSRLASSVGKGSQPLSAFYRSLAA